MYSSFNFNYYILITNLVLSLPHPAPHLPPQLKYFKANPKGCL